LTCIALKKSTTSIWSPAGPRRGDDVLRAAAVTLKKSVAHLGLGISHGGDEFALSLAANDAEQALALSRRVETVFEEQLKPCSSVSSSGMDHGVANFPQTVNKRINNPRRRRTGLYRLKQAKSQ